MSNIPTKDTPQVPCAAWMWSLLLLHVWLCFVVWWVLFQIRNICWFWVFSKTKKHSDPTNFDTYLHVTVKRTTSWFSLEACSSLLAALPHPWSTSPQTGTNQAPEGTDPEHSWSRFILHLLELLSYFPFFSLLLGGQTRRESTECVWESPWEI